jgi:predicted outer membrane repeat protein
MKKIKLVIVVLTMLILSLINCTLFAITVEGCVFLENQTDHSGIEILFERTIPSSITYTSYTDSNGYYNIAVEDGIYDVTYSKSDYFNEWLMEQILYSDTTLSDITLLEHITVINVPSVFTTIQSAIDHAYVNDTILVAPGTYVENIDYNGKNITVASLFLTTQDTSYISQTIIDGGHNDSVIIFDSGENYTAILNGFTIQNGYAQGGSSPYFPAGGITCCQYSSPSLRNLIISNNSSFYGGGITCCQSSHPSLENVTISNNSVNGTGGGIVCYDNASPDLENVTINNNSSTQSGGGIVCQGGSSPSLENVTISNNSANYVGGGILCNQSSISLENVTISNNSANRDGGGIWSYYSSINLENVTINNNSADWDGGGIFCESLSDLSLVNTIVSNNTNYGVYMEAGNVSITYSDFYNNQNGNFYNCGQWIGVNFTTNTNGDSCDVYYNIQLDPLFVDPLNEDYHLTESSPCIDAGDPSYPLDPNETIIDIGAFYYEQANLTPIIGNNPTSLDFGVLDVGLSNNLTLEISNFGSLSLEIIEIIDASASYFNFISITDSIIAPSGSSTLEIEFAPLTEGMFSDSLFIISNAVNDDTLGIALFGEGGIIPAPVEDLIIQINGIDAVLDWSPVTETISGNPIIIDAYLVYYCGLPNDDFYFYGYTPNTTYTHPGVVQFADHMFYQVTAYVGSIGRLDSIIANHRNLKLNQLNELIKSK